MTPVRLYSLVAVAVVFAAVPTIRYFRRHRKTDADRERERRDLINRIGRITDGTVTDVREITLDGRGHVPRPVQLVIYQYDVAGVSYEAAQDVTYLRQLIDLHACRLGLPASIKYDPHNAGNSIVIAEGWSGLRM
jgi:hypothetical protein